MAANGQGKEQRKRVGPSMVSGKASRVSRAAGNIGSEAMRVEQRSSSAATKQRASNAQNSSRQAKSGKGKQSAKKGSSANRPVPTPAPPPQPADSRAIAKMHARWQTLAPHHKQRLFSFLLLILAFLLFGGLTFWKGVSLLESVGKLFTNFFGWGAYPLAFGLIVFAIAHLVEGVRNVRFIRWSLVIGLLVVLLLLLAEGSLIAGKSSANGYFGTWLSLPLTGWRGPIPHVLLIGLLVIAIIFTFRIRHGHVRSVAGFVKKAIPQRSPASSNGAAASPFAGQRPRFSRFAQHKAPQAQAPAQSDVNDGEDDEWDDNYPDIDFDADFDEKDDPLNDINLHKQQVGKVPRGNRAAPPLNRDEHQAAVKGARQQPLPFNQSGASDESGDEDFQHEMEPLAPNPLKQARIVTRAANAKGIIESPWKLSDVTLLNHPEDVKMHALGDDTFSLAKIIQDTLRSFRVDAEVKPEDISIGPTVIRFGIRPTGKPIYRQDEKGKLVPQKDGAGNIVYEQRTRVSRIMALQNDLALVLEAKSIRMEAPVPGRPYVGVEIPNKNSRLVTLREILESKEYAAARGKSKLAMALGKDVGGAVRVGDLARMPHLLIAGATGAGKSVCLNAIIGSFLTQATPDDVRMLMVDPKMVELNMYNGIPHLLSPVVTEVDKVVGLLKIAIAEMEKRYRLFSQLNVRNLDGYRKLRTERMARGDTTLKNLPAIVIIIDELADLMMAAPEEVEGLICRLAQLARATGIHLIIATQRPSVDVITGLIKANIPTRISFMVSSSVDSRTIIDMGGAERLLGRGDMLYLPADAGKPERIQGAFVADDEAERLVSYWKQQAVEHANAASTMQGGSSLPSMVVPPVVEPGWEVSDHISDEFELDDELFEQAAQVVQEYERASISLLQRRLRIGYSRAARLIDLLEERGIIGRIESGGRAREVYDKRDRHGSGEGRTMADEADDIIAEERARDEFLKKQSSNGNGNRPPSGSPNNGRPREEDV